MKMFDATKNERTKPVLIVSEGQWENHPQRAADGPLTGFHIGKDLRRVREDMPSWWRGSADNWNAGAMRYNAALCARGLDRWEDDGGASSTAA